VDVKTNRNEIVFLLAVCVLALVALTCGTPDVDEEPEEPEVTCPSPGIDPQPNCDEFKRLNAKVLYNSVEHTASGWHLFNDGDTLSTDETGQAQVNVSDCWPGEIYIFKKSGYGFRVEDCVRALFPSSTHCTPFGTWYVGDCADEFDVIWTGSARITKTGSTFSVTYLPEDRLTTLVVVLDGTVRVEPITSFELEQPGPPTPVEAGWFYFTMPDDALSAVGDLEPRAQHRVSSLAPVAAELGIEDWMNDVREKAEEDGVLPDSWPQELGGLGIIGPAPGEAFVVTMGGGALSEPSVQEGVLWTVDWSTVQQVTMPEGGEVWAYLGEALVDAIQDRPLDPSAAYAKLQAARDELGFGGLVILYPAEDETLGVAAELAMEYLGQEALEILLEPVPEEELESKTATMIEQGQEVMVLRR
jgi:hypothetical protein